MKNIIISFLSLIFSFTLIEASRATVKADFLIDNQRSLTMAAGESSLWEFRFFKDNGKQITKFMSMHAKKMHMVIIKKDLSHIAHVHPYLQADGRFLLRSNSFYKDDFDNGATSLMTPSAGDYYVFVETMPMGTKRPQGKMLVNRYQLKVTNSKETIQNLDNDEKYKNAKSFLKYFDKDGNYSKTPSYYRVVLDYEMYDFCNYYLPKFYLTVYYKSAKKYLPVSNFSRWLSMGGHAVLIKSDNMPLEKKIFKHLHSFLPISTPGEFTFPYHDHKKPLPSGNYKIWTQHRIGDRVLTFDFTFYLDVPTINNSLKNNSKINKCR